MAELPQQETDEHPTGHYRLAGSALMSLGGLGIILAITRTRSRGGVGFYRRSVHGGNLIDYVSYRPLDV